VKERKDRVKERKKDVLFQFLDYKIITMPKPNFIIISPAFLQAKHADRHMTSPLYAVMYGDQEHAIKHTTICVM
jgi:hypothetical protein